MSSPSPTSFSLVLSLTNAVVASPSASDASTSHSSGSSAVKVAAIIIPVVIILSITFYGLAVAGGIMHHRRRGSHSDATASSTDGFSEKRVDLANEPRLWEVSLTTSSQDGGHKALRPLAMEMHPAEKNPPSLTKGCEIYTQCTNPSQRKLRPWTSIASTSTLSSKSSLSQSSLYSHPAQVAVIVAMPSIRDGRAEAANHFAIGTRPVLYETEAPPRIPPPTPPPIPQPAHRPQAAAPPDRSMVLSLSAYGYFY